MVSSVLLVAIFISVLITIHEFGHLLVAKLSKIPVEVFSIGFGPALLKRKIGETEYRLSVVPLGGYIKMVGENDTTAPTQGGVEGFNQKPLRVKAAVIAAGPVSNLVLGFVFLLVMYASFGLKYFAPVLDPLPGSPATLAGLRSGDLVLFAAGETIPGFEALEQLIGRYAGRSLDLVVLREGKRLQLTYPVPEDTWLSPRLLAAAVGGVKPGSPAEQLGLTAGDTIVSVDGTTIERWDQLTAVVRTCGDKRIPIAWRRNGQIFSDSITPSVQTDPKTKARTGQLGVWAAAQRRYLEPLVPPVIGQVRKLGPADKAGLRRGDTVLTVAGMQVLNWDDLTRLIGERTGTRTEITWRRHGQTFTESVLPILETDQLTGLRSGEIGIWAELPRKWPSIPSAAWMALSRTGHVVVQTFVILYNVVTRRISGRAIGGPIMVAKIAYEGANWGAEYFIALWALLSINLFVVNMLPVPVLDGGRILLFVIERIRRRPLSEKELSWAGNVGWLLVGALVVFTLLNDVLRLFIRK